MGNDRVEQFTAQGEFLLKWGSSGLKDRQFNHPAGIVVDGDGLVYVVDWRDNLVPVCDSPGN
jgi:DNA-binding beta-propeller fold protein YncE